MTTWRGNHYWFAPDERAVVTYRLVGWVAITVGDPIGDPVAIPAAANGFAGFRVAERVTAGITLLVGNGRLIRFLS
jgi:phosphatidylglycerol lysyltransferase